MVPLLLAGAALAPVIGGIVGKIMSAPSEAEQMRLMRLAAEQYNIPLPDLQQMVAEQVSTQGFEAAPGLKAAQLSALDELQTLGREGFNIQDRAAINQSLGEAAQFERQQRDAIDANMARRGMSNSGFALASKLGAQQAGANAANANALNVAAQGRARALDAMMAGGSLAGQMRGQQLQERSSKAEMERFNAANSMDAQRYNIGRAQQQFDNQASLATGKANALAGTANIYGQRGQRDAATGAGVGAGLGQAAGAAAGYQAQDDFLTQMRKKQQGGS